MKKIVIILIITTFFLGSISPMTSSTAYAEVPFVSDASLAPLCDGKNCTYQIEFEEPSDNRSPSGPSRVEIYMGELDCKANTCTTTDANGKKIELNPNDPYQYPISFSEQITFKSNQHSTDPNQLQNDIGTFFKKSFQNHYKKDWPNSPRTNLDIDLTPYKGKKVQLYFKPFVLEWKVNLVRKSNATTTIGQIKALAPILDTKGNLSGEILERTSSSLPPASKNGKTSQHQNITKTLKIPSSEDEDCGFLESSIQNCRIEIRTTSDTSTWNPSMNQVIGTMTCIESICKPNLRKEELTFPMVWKFKDVDKELQPSYQSLFGNYLKHVNKSKDNWNTVLSQKIVDQDLENISEAGDLVFIPRQRVVKASIVKVKKGFFDALLFWTDSKVEETVIGTIQTTRIDNGKVSLVQNSAKQYDERLREDYFSQLTLGTNIAFGGLKPTATPKQITFGQTTPTLHPTQSTPNATNPIPDLSKPKLKPTKPVSSPPKPKPKPKPTDPPKKKPVPKPTKPPKEKPVPTPVEPPKETPTPTPVNPPKETPKELQFIISKWESLPQKAKDLIKEILDFFS